MIILLVVIEIVCDIASTVILIPTQEFTSLKHCERVLGALVLVRLSLLIGFFAYLSGYLAAWQW